MALHNEVTSVTFKAKIQKCKPSLGPVVKTISHRLQSSNKMLTQKQFHADPDTAQPIT